LDGLTQIANRRYFDCYLHQEWQRHFRTQEPLSLILADIDFFKPYNDYYGHQAGDTCLKQVAQTIQQTVQRPADLVARYGGEELSVILPNTTAAGAVHVAELICAAIRQLQIPHRQSLASSQVTLSLGASSLIPEPDAQAASLVALADQALYLAKRQGRNRYCLHTGAEAFCQGQLTR
jgi:diguanylate cyclase (GGDEF)-like protein